MNILSFYRALFLQVCFVVVYGASQHKYEAPPLDEPPPIPGQRGTKEDIEYHGTFPPHLDTLRQIYHLTGGDEWKNNRGWRTMNRGPQSDPCGHRHYADEPLEPWEGVHCNDMGKVVQLRLPNNGLVTDDVAALLGFVVGITTLRTLDLSHNGISGDFPRPFHQIEELPVLMHFDISHNEITGDIHDLRVTRLANLRVFKVNNNLFTGRLPETVFSREKVKIIDFSRNSFEGSIPPFDDLKQVNTINLSHNQLDGTIPELRENRELVRFDLSHNSLSGGLPSETSGLDHLIYIDLSHNELTGTIPHALVMHPIRNIINLSHNLLTTHLPEFLKEAKESLELNIHGNPFDCPVPEWAFRFQARCRRDASDDPYEPAHDEL